MATPAAARYIQAIDIALDSGPFTAVCHPVIGLIVHRDVRREVDEYWASVFGPTVGVTFPTSIAAFMEWNRKPGLVFPTFSPRQEARLRRTLGEPHYEDRDLLVWRLGSQVAPTARILEGRRLPGVMVGRHSSH